MKEKYLPEIAVKILSNPENKPSQRENSRSGFVTNSQMPREKTKHKMRAQPIISKKYLCRYFLSEIFGSSYALKIQQITSRCLQLLLHLKANGLRVLFCWQRLQKPKQTMKRIQHLNSSLRFFFQICKRHKRQRK